MSVVGKPARERPALRLALVAADPIRHQSLIATAVQIDAALLAAAAGLIVRVPSLPSPSFEALDDSEAPLLTPRETDVLVAIADGLSNKAAARRLGISQHTVKFHVESLFRKLGAVSRADAVRKGLRQRLFEI